MRSARSGPNSLAADEYLIGAPALQTQPEGKRRSSAGTKPASLPARAARAAATNAPDSDIRTLGTSSTSSRPGSGGVFTRDKRGPRGRRASCMSRHAGATPGPRAARRERHAESKQHAERRRLRAQSSACSAATQSRPVEQGGWAGPACSKARVCPRPGCSRGSRGRAPEIGNPQNSS